MIPKDHLQAWSAIAPWPDPRQVEQDLIISRALCDLFTAKDLDGKLAFRGGTAINKLLFAKPLRYSEDIDLVQPAAAPIGKTVDAVRDALGWLGKCKVDISGHSTHLFFTFTPDADNDAKLRLKVEINGREHGAMHGFTMYPFEVDNPWYSGKAQIFSFRAEELFATKLRALLQRQKGRDLFDLKEGLAQLELDPGMLMAAFEYYLAAEGKKITRANAEATMLGKLKRSLTEDVTPLLPDGVTYTDADALAAFETVWFELIARINGDPWKTSPAAIEELRKTLGKTFLQAKTAA